MESICDAPFPASSRQNKIEHLSLGTPFEIAKAQKRCRVKASRSSIRHPNAFMQPFPEYQERTENTMQFAC
jgi:hypothetical protein